MGERGGSLPRGQETKSGGVNDEQRPSPDLLEKKRKFLPLSFFSPFFPPFLAKRKRREGKKEKEGKTKTRKKNSEQKEREKEGRKKQKEGSFFSFFDRSIGEAIAEIDELLEEGRCSPRSSC
jgi:hypothetical protein